MIVAYAPKFPDPFFCRALIIVIAVTIKYCILRLYICTWQKEFLVLSIPRFVNEGEGIMIFMPCLIVNKNVLRKEADFVRGICGAHGGYKTAKVRDVRRIGVGRGLRGETEKRMGGAFPGRPQSFRHQGRPIDDCRPGQVEMAQDGGTRCGMFHGEIDRCRER